MKMSSIVVKMMVPLVISTIFVVAVTLFVTQTYLKQVVEDVFMELQVHHLETIYNLKMENVLTSIKKNGIAIATSPHIKKFLTSEDASQGKISSEIKQILKEFKELYSLEHIYVAQTSSKNYFNETGFVKVVNPKDKESQWFLKTLQSNQKYLLNADSDITGSLHIWADIAVDNESQRVGLAGCAMDMHDIYKLTLEDFKHNSADILILDDSNIIQGSSNNSKLLHQSLTKSLLLKEKISAIQYAQKNNQILAKYGFNNEERYILFIPIKELHFNIIVDFSKEKFLNYLHGIYNRIIIGGVVFLFLLLLIGGLSFTYLISIPLSKVASAVNQFDYASDFELKICKTMGYEIDMICNAFNKNAKLLTSILHKYKNNEELLKNIINAADDLIFYKDVNLVYLGCNSAYEKWRSKSADEIIGTTDEDFYPQEIARQHNITDRVTIAGNKTNFLEEELQNKNGETVILQVKKSPFYDKNGQIAGIVVVARDITVFKHMEDDLRILNNTLELQIEKKTEELQKTNLLLSEHITNLELLNIELRDAKEKAQQAAQAKSNFISGISHELRTPLNSIINFTDQIIEDFDEMLEDKELQIDTRMYLSRVIQNSRYLLQLINDLLEFTKAEVGKMTYNIEEHNINNIIKIAYNNTFSLLNGTHVEFYLALHDKPLMSLVDERKFLQVLLNLLSNAMKFTQKGYVKIKSFTKDDSIIIEIEDTGKGIPMEKYKIIFEPFMQAKSTDNGTGLGLGLAKKMCDDMNIKISFDSIEGSGTTFRLMLKNVNYL